MPHWLPVARADGRAVPRESVERALDELGRDVEVYGRADEARRVVCQRAHSALRLWDRVSAFARFPARREGAATRRRVAACVVLRASCAGEGCPARRAWASRA